ncbi:ATP-binding protein [Sphingobacterium oryzagri]|uniref:histidine kinase n=1 Tax=Sphingobacterium oryzagri TaxID=3025669 RepID=A0ABY7WLR5_9SPHI|nr:ATP-binding protein [Sphingobacterium sp. KACC 22765]WDF70551.1 ATP-binding protein [Sphingobacterium sp. KACC 22765]
MANVNPSSEQQRIAALQSYNILDSGIEEDYEELTSLAAAICGTPIALISLVDSERQWFKSHIGLDVSETVRSQSFCAHAIQQPTALLQVKDARTDERFKDNPLVTGKPNITFYAGMPLVDEEGYALGSICVIDHQPRELNGIQEKALRTIARQVITKLSLRRKVMELHAIEAQNRVLHEITRKSESNLRGIIEQSPAAIIVFRGEALRIEAANPPMLELLDQQADIVGKPLLEAIPELDGQPAYHLLYEIYQTGKPVYGYDTPVQLKRNGVVETGYFNFTYKPLYEDDQIVGVIDMAVEVTEQVKARMALQESELRLQKANVKLEQNEENLRMAVASANLGTWLLHTHNQAFHPSVRMKALFGFPEQEDMPFEDAMAQIADSHRQQVRQMLAHAMKTGAHMDIEFPILGKYDKKLRWVRATGKLYSNVNKAQETHFSGTLADITERKLDEQRRSDFIGMVSHELRTPLTAINGFLQILALKARRLADPSVAEIATKAERQADRMGTLINGFLDVARLGEGKIVLQQRDFDMAALLQLVEAESFIGSGSHQVIFLPGVYLPVRADQDKIEQVLINFINNAIKYSPKGSAIEVSCIANESSAVVRVQDQGMGISAKEQLRVFERFYRVESDEMKVTNGFGIGLYICKEIIERHGGEIGVISEQGKGSTFWFALPLREG